VIFCVATKPQSVCGLQTPVPAIVPSSKGGARRRMASDQAALNCLVGRAEGSRSNLAAAIICAHIVDRWC
jgi:hypothetical protein